MPLYKYVGNRILTTFENAAVGLDLSEWHSGYRAYSVEALSEIPFDKNSDGFDFDTQIIIQLHEAGKRIVEVPIPTYYGDEICYVNGLRYAADVTKWSLRYRAHKMGFGTGELAFATRCLRAQGATDDSSHGRLALAGSAAASPAGSSTSAAPTARSARCSRHGPRGHRRRHRWSIAGVGERLDRLRRGRPRSGHPRRRSGPATTWSRGRRPRARADPGAAVPAGRCCRPAGSMITSVPNFGHWYPRARVALGRFDYDRRGILDRGHVRFFTRRSFERLVDRVGLRVRRQEALGLPSTLPDRGAMTATAGVAAGHGAVGAVNRSTRLQ